MGATGVWQIVNAVHRRLRNRKPGRVAHYRLAVVPLHQSTGVIRIRFVVNDFRRFGEQWFIGGNLLETGEHEGIGWRLHSSDRQH